MRRAVAITIATILGISPTAPISAAAGDRALGVIEAADRAHLDGTAAANGTNFFAGEELATENGGSLQARIEESHVELGAASEARFLSGPDPVDIELTRGSTRFSSPAKHPISIETPAGVVRGEDGHATSGMIVLTDGQNLVITAYTEGLILDNGGELHWIAPGRSYRVAVQDPDIPPVSTVNKHRRRKLILWLIGGGVAAYAIGNIWDEIAESPTTPDSN